MTKNKCSKVKGNGNAIVHKLCVATKIFNYFRFEWIAEGFSDIYFRIGNVVEKQFISSDKNMQNKLVMLSSEVLGFERMSKATGSNSAFILDYSNQNGWDENINKTFRLTTCSQLEIPFVSSTNYAQGIFKWTTSDTCTVFSTINVSAGGEFRLILENKFVICTF